MSIMFNTPLREVVAQKSKDLGSNRNSASGT
jgi:hypothetical protein